MWNEAGNGCQLQNLVFTKLVEGDKNGRDEEPLALSDLRRNFRCSSRRCYPWSSRSCSVLDVHGTLESEIDALPNLFLTISTMYNKLMQLLRLLLTYISNIL